MASNSKTHIVPSSTIPTAAVISGNGAHGVQTASVPAPAATQAPAPRRIVMRAQPVKPTAVERLHNAGPSKAELEAELDKLRAENNRLREKQNRPVSLKVSGKGAVSVYGLGRFPVTLYMSQWEKLLDCMEDIKAFIAENAASLAVKE